MPLSTVGPGHQVRKGGKQLFVFDLHHLSENNERKVWGLASCPDIDREGEVILKKAIEESLHDFMALPIMHLNHTERPIGWFTKAEFRGQDLYVEGRIKPTPDCDDVWNDVLSGKLSQWSIFGDRTDATPSCALNPENRTEPCVTKALALYSITLCDRNTAINSKTFAEVMKSIIKAQSLVEKATDSASNLIHPTTDGKYPKEVTKTMEPEDEKKKVPPETPAPEQDPAQEPSGEGSEIKQLLTAIVERLQSLESSIGLNKADPPEEKKDEDEEKENKEVQKCPACAKKAEVPPAAAPEPSTFTKAELGRISKAEERITALENELATLRKSIAKPPSVFVIDPKAAKEGESQDPTKPTVQKSAGASNASNFEKIYKTR